MTRVNSTIHEILERIPSLKDLKLRDAKLIADYFIRQENGKVVSRQELQNHSGADPFRVDPIIMEFLHHRLIHPVENNLWGVPSAYRWSIDE